MLRWVQLAFVVTAITATDMRLAAVDCSAPSVFACTLESESTGDDVHLGGWLRVRENRIEFEAYPQVEYITWHCGQITTIEVTGRHKTTVAIRSADTSYSFDLRTSAQASSFVETARCGCPKND
jgi:hypothetical protein